MPVEYPISIIKKKLTFCQIKKKKQKQQGHVQQKERKDRNNVLISFAINLICNERKCKKNKVVKNINKSKI